MLPSCIICCMAHIQTYCWPWQPCAYDHRLCVNTVLIHTNLKCQTQTSVTSLQHYCLLSLRIYFSTLFHLLKTFFSLAFPSKHVWVCHKLWDHLRCVCESCLLHFPRCIYVYASELAVRDPGPFLTSAAMDVFCVLFTQTCTWTQLSVADQISILVVNVSKHKWTDCAINYLL